MVREVSGLHIELDENEPPKPEVSVDGGFARAPVSNQDLVDAFARYASTHRGGFESLLVRWVANRVNQNLPVDMEDPEALNVPPALRKALESAFQRVRKRSR